MPYEDEGSWLEQHHSVKPIEGEVLSLVADGQSDHQIALRLVISERAVKERVRDFCEREEFEARGGRRLPAWCARHLACCISVKK